MLSKATAVALSSAVAVLLGACTDTPGDETPAGAASPAIGSPAPSSAVHPARRRIVYTDDYWPTWTLHLGGRVIDVRLQVAAAYRKAAWIDEVVHMDVTDGGVVFTSPDGGIWFTDGRTTGRIGTAGMLLGWMWDSSVRTGNTGALAAWTERSGARVWQLVVYDTASGEVAGRRTIPGCRPLGNPRSCTTAAVLGEDVVYYWGAGDTRKGRWRPRLFRFIVSTGSSEPTTQQAYRNELRRSPRGLIRGHTPAAGIPTDGIAQPFVLAGRRLVPVKPGAIVPSRRDATAVFASGTGQRVRFTLPDGYQGAPDYTLVQWLDDDRVVLAAQAHAWAESPGRYDVLVCRLSDGHCRLAVPGPDAAPSRNDHDFDIVRMRVFPHLQLPG